MRGDVCAIKNSLNKMNMAIADAMEARTSPIKIIIFRYLTILIERKEVICL